MKEYEKLAKEYSNGTFAQSFSVNPIQIGYEAGFLKCREMAAEHIAINLNTFSIDILNLGERSVD